MTMTGARGQAATGLVAVARKMYFLAIDPAVVVASDLSGIYIYI